MSRTTRFLLFALALCLLMPALASAQPAPGSFSLTPFLMTVRVVGAGETVADAQANALAELRKTYLVLSYSTGSSGCSEIALDPVNDPSDTITLCWAEIFAKVIRKVPLFP